MVALFARKKTEIILELAHDPEEVFALQHCGPCSVLALGQVEVTDELTGDLSRCFAKQFPLHDDSHSFGEYCLPQ